MMIGGCPGAEMDATRHSSPANHNHRPRVLPLPRGAGWDVEGRRDRLVAFQRFIDTP